MFFGISNNHGELCFVRFRPAAVLLQIYQVRSQETTLITKNEQKMERKLPLKGEDTNALYVESKLQQ
jgi:hypothetical protein